MLARSQKNRASLSMCCGFLALTVLWAGTLAGCAQQPAADAKKELEKLKKKEKPKPNFDTFRIYTEPNERSTVDPKLKDPPRVSRTIKPGHWGTVLVETKANNFDFSGELTSAALAVSGAPLVLDRNPFRLDTARGISLAKGQPKTMESVFFPPRSSHMTTFIANRLRNSGGGEESPLFQDPLLHLPSYQYFMVVLTRDNSRYTFLKTLDSVLPLSDLMSINPQDMAYYRLVAPISNQPLALSSQSLCWTNTAWLLWDDALPASLTPEQQQALVDWVHWGGQIAVSGPAGLDLLRGSFLDRYLPADAPDAAVLDAAALTELSEQWTLPSANGEKRAPRLTAPWPGVKLVVRENGQFVAGTGQLVAERQVGRGRIVATAFRLNERDLWNWPSFDSFFNGAILRRPPRRYAMQLGRLEWTDGRDPLDPTLASNVRYFTRDDGDNSAEKIIPVPLPTDPNNPFMHRPAPSGAAAGAPLTSIPGTPNAFEHDVSQVVDAAKTQSGVAAWNDFSSPSMAARMTLREAAGISVPKRRFVAWMLGAYLIAIVPVNWLVFKLLGRVEWAWIAVPIVSIGWGVAVVYLAQLDIGFARSETEVAVLELQGGFARAHLTRYTALYSSLSTSYDVEFDDTTALAQPFSPDSVVIADQTISTVTLRTASHRQLDGYPVSSNSTGMVHSEQMVDVGGELRWIVQADQLPRVENQTKLKLSGAAVLRSTRYDARHVVDEAAWLGELLPGATADVRFQKYDKELLVDARDSDELTSVELVKGSLNLRRMIDCAEDIQRLPAGQVRLVAWREGSLAGQSIEPSAAQARRATLVVANLQYSSLLPARPDESLRTHRPAFENLELDAELAP